MHFSVCDNVVVVGVVVVVDVNNSGPYQSEKLSTSAPLWRALSITLSRCNQSG